MKGTPGPYFPFSRSLQFNLDPQRLRTPIKEERTKSIQLGKRRRERRDELWVQLAIPAAMGVWLCALSCPSLCLPLGPQKFRERVCVSVFVIVIEQAKQLSMCWISLYNFGHPPPRVAALLFSWERESMQLLIRLRFRVLIGDRIQAQARAVLIECSSPGWRNV